jgi:hypothetical protein
VLKGVRFLSQELADEILRQLRISVMDLVRAEEIGPSLRHASPVRRGEIAVPVLGERLGPGCPFPSREVVKGFMLVPSWGLESVRDPALVFLAPDAGLEAWFPGAAVALLDFDLDPTAAGRATLWCALNLSGVGCLRQVVLLEGRLRVVQGDSEFNQANELELEVQSVRAAARAVVLWIGRDFPGPSGLSQDGFLAVSS